MIQTFNPREAGQVGEFKVSLVYKMSFRIVRAVKKDKPCLENKTKK